MEDRQIRDTKHYLSAGARAIALLCFAIISGFGVSSPPERRIAVEYMAQENDTLCQSAAVGMLLTKLTGASASQKEIQKQLDQLGGHVTHKARAGYLKKHLPGWIVSNRYQSDERMAWTEITGMLSIDIPVLISTRLTKSGHVILVVGAREVNGKRLLVVHDPWGRFDFGKRSFVSKNGKSVEYPFEELMVKNREVLAFAKDGQQKYMLQQYCIGTREWLPIAGQTLLLTAGQPQVRKTLADWEYVVVTKKACMK